MKLIYLDSNILIAYFGRVKAEEEKKKIVLGALEVFGKTPNVRIVTSAWAIAETINILLSNFRMKEVEVSKIENRLTNERRIAGFKIQILDVSPVKDYDFQEFFYNIRQGILAYHSGVGDTIHSVIMKNYSIDIILTLDDGDFVKIPGLTVINPKVTKVEKN